MSSNQQNRDALPFLKWAGGKRWLVDNHLYLLQTEYNSFIEPFLGSGAAFFKLTPQSAILSDKNADLIETYIAIKQDWKKVKSKLNFHHNRHSKDYYYKVRSSRPRDPAYKAAKLIYLNRACWNGLYRVNLKGQFNVPIGTKTNIVLESDDFEKTAALLSNTQIFNCDFETSIDKAKSNDLVFVDPPYTVKHNHNGFIKYNEALFSWDDQIRLRNCIERAIGRGAKVLVTNANHDCIKELYKNIGNKINLTRASVISGKSNYRGKYEELVIKCF